MLKWCPICQNRTEHKALSLDTLRIESSSVNAECNICKAKAVVYSDFGKIQMLELRIANLEKHFPDKNTYNCQTCTGDNGAFCEICSSLYGG